MAAAVAVALGSSPLQGATFHVSTAGRDTDPGTPAKPFASLTRARDAVRQVRSGGRLPEPVTVVVHGGTYRLEASLTLGPGDSGSETSPVVWQGAPGEEVRLAGGILVPTSLFQPATDPAQLEQLDPAARGKVVQASLRGLGLGEPGEYADSFRGVPATPELFFNDQRMSLARWPNQGWATIARIVDTGSIPRERTP